MAKRSAIRVVNLEAGLPDRKEAITRLDQAIAQAITDRIRVLKIIHGYGSSGSGGVLQRVVRSQLRQMKEAGRVKLFITGESWSQFDDFSKQLLKQIPESLLDHDLGRANRGITFVLM